MRSAFPGPADGHKVASDGEIHHGVRSGFARDGKLAHFAGGMVLERRGSDIGVHLNLGRLPHQHGATPGCAGLPSNTMFPASMAATIASADRPSCRVSVGKCVFSTVRRTEF